MLTLTTHYTQYSQYSRLISFFSLCLTQWQVEDCGHPVSVWRQYEQTEASRVKARHSETLDLRGIPRSSSFSKSVWYSIKYALINTASSISTGRSLTDVYSNKLQHRLYFSYCSVRSFQLIYTTQLIHNTSICLFTCMTATHHVIKYGNISQRTIIRKFRKCVRKWPDFGDIRYIKRDCDGKMIKAARNGSSGTRNSSSGRPYVLIVTFF